MAQRKSKPAQENQSLTKKIVGQRELAGTIRTNARRAPTRSPTLRRLAPCDGRRRDPAPAAAREDYVGALPPLNSAPGVAPVHSPFSNVTSPFTSVQR